MPLPRRRQVRRRRSAAATRRRARRTRQEGGRRHPRRPRASTASTTSTDSITVTAAGLTIRRATWSAADGMWSPIRKALGAGEPGYLGEWHGFRQYAPERDRPCRRAAVRVVRARPHARLRLVVPAPQWSGQHRLRRAPRRRTPDPVDEGTVGGSAPAAAHPSRHSANTSSSRTATPPGRSRPASTRSPSPAGARCSSATPPPRPT